MTEPAASALEGPLAIKPASPSAPTFDVLPLGSEVRRAIDAMGYRHPTPVQTAVFEPASEGRSLVVQARTGTGKTAAFGLPLIDRLVRSTVKGVQALILCPTRELALQVSRELALIGQFKSTKVVAIYGGAPMGRQIEALQEGAQIVVGTPGRVLDHLRQKTLDPSGVKTLVLDEADEMLSMGFARELNAIIETLPKNRQGLFFSATIPADIERLAHTHLKDTEMVTLSSDQVGALEISHFVYLLQSGDKLSQLVRILEVEDPESAVIFCNTRDETQRIAEALKARGFDADWLNGDLPQSDRERVMSATREGRLRFLVATDVAARGIDISHLTHVINHDFPESAEQYVHRTGRTGRAGRTGTAISIVGPKDIGNLYLLRLTYKIRPIEKQLPSAGEMKTRAEMDLLGLFAEAFTSRPVHPEDLSLARRLLTHDEAERIVAGLLRDHLGARGADVATSAAEKRRGRNPEPQPEPAAQQAPVARPSPREDAGPATREGASRRGPPRDRGDRRPRIDASDRDPRRSAATATSGWRPPPEPDDERPILGAAATPPAAVAPARDSGASLPGFTVADPSPVVPTEGAPGYLELFVNVGKRENLRTSDLEQLLISRGVGLDGVGRIRIRDRNTFISVKKEAADTITAALSGQVVGGRTVVAEVARGRS
jgi:ATP-dependent RNA helicase DeaD